VVLFWPFEWFAPAKMIITQFAVADMRRGRAKRIHSQWLPFEWFASAKVLIAQIAVADMRRGRANRIHSQWFFFLAFRMVCSSKDAGHTNCSS